MSTNAHTHKYTNSSFRDRSNVNISYTSQPWVCIGIDGSSMFVLMVSFLTLTAAAVMANRIYRYIDDEDDTDEYIVSLFGVRKGLWLD